MLLRDALDFFLRGPHSHSTRQTYRSILSRAVQKLGPDRPITNLSLIDMKSYEHELYAAGYKPGSVRSHVKIVQLFFNFCVENELIQTSPARTMKPGKPSRRDAETKAATPRELALMLDYTRYDLRVNALVAFIAQSGVRAGEAAGLRVDDIDFESNTAKIMGKGSIRRIVIFGRGAGGSIQKWLEARAVQKIDNPQVFAANSKPFTGRRVTYAVGHVSDKVCSRRVTPHMLRHLFIETLLMNSVPTTVVEKLVGHVDDKQIRLTYGPRDLRNAKAAAIPVINSLLAVGALSEPEHLEMIDEKIIAFPRGN